MLIRCIDVETTGLDPAIHHVCEVATVDVIVTVPGDGGGRPLQCERGRMWSSLINPSIPIPPEASAVHDITDEMVKDAPTLANLIPSIHGVAEPYGPPDYWCAHNSRFDQKFVNLPGIWLDTYRIALWLWPSVPSHSNACLRYYLKLSFAMHDLRLALENANDGTERMLLRNHTAIFDAYVTAAILRKAFLAGATIEQMIEVSSQLALLPRFTFGKWAMKPVETIDGGYLDWILGQRDMNEDVRHTAFAELQRRRNLEKLNKE